jgi:catalase
VHNNQRDGMHRQGIARGRVAYEPNSLGGGCPFQAGTQGFMSFPQPVQEDKVRGKPEKFAEHYNQATLFWNSQSEPEKLHIIRAYRFELTKVQVVAVRERVIAQLRNVTEELAQAVADGLGLSELPAPLPLALKRAPPPETTRSKALSLLARPGQEGIKTRRVAILVADGIDADMATQLHSQLSAMGAVPRFVGIKLGAVMSNQDSELPVEISMETAPSPTWDAVIVPHGQDATSIFSRSGHALEFLKDQYRHCKPLLLAGSAGALLKVAGIPPQLECGSEDPGLIQADPRQLEAGLAAFVEALERHRHFERETDPPRV